MFKTILNRGLILLLILGCAYLGVLNYKLTRARAEETAAKTAALADVAKLLGAKPVQVVRTVTITNTKLVPVVEKAKANGGIPVEHGTTVATISDKETAAPTPTGWDDPHHRFHLELPSGVFTRQQRFKFESVVVRAADGKSKFSQSALTEYDPVTGEALDDSGIKLDTSLQEVNESAPSASLFHPRAVFAFDHRAALGLGVNFFEYHSLDLSVLGFYDRKSGKADLSIFGGYRLVFPFLNSNISIGPYYSVTGRTLGAAATIQLTR